MRWGLIGASTIAAEHMIPAIRAQKECAIEWVVSGSDARAKSFASEHGINQFGTDIEAMLNDDGVDAVYISSTNEKHLPQALKALENDKHVICEKPLALNVEDATNMVQAAQSCGKIFATNHHLRCSGSHRAMSICLRIFRVGASIMPMQAAASSLTLPFMMPMWCASC